MWDYIFERVTVQDLNELLEIYNYYVLNTTSTFHSKALSLEDIRELLIFNDSKYGTFVIKENKAIIGYVILTQHKKREAYDSTGEVSVYLKNGCTSKGIGSIALKFIESFAMEHGFHSLIATVCGENEKSIRVFEKNGYTKCAHFKEIGMKFGRWLDVVSYQKII